MRSEGFFTYSRGVYTNFLQEERKMHRRFFARRAYSTHFTRRVEKNRILYILCQKISYTTRVYDLRSRSDRMDEWPAQPV